MSIVPKETIEVIAQSIGINSLSSDVALALAPDVEYRVREIMQEAIKCMRHSRRVVLTAQDVDSALNLRNVEPLYGFASNDPLRFKKAAGHKDLFYVDDKDLEFKDVIEATLPRAPLDTAVVAHWLAIEGVQPAIPENPPIDGKWIHTEICLNIGIPTIVSVLTAPVDGKKSEYKEDGLPVDIKLPVKHVLTRELQLYFDKVIELITRKSDSVLFKAALTSLATDPGLHSLVPYFTYFIAEEVSRSLNDYSLLFALMRVVWSLLQNQHIHVEPYLHQMMPPVMTCLVGKRLGSRLFENHWELRKFSANLVGTICRRFGHVHHNLQPRVTRTLLHAFLDPTKALPQHYGAIQGLAALGPNVVQLLILPNLEPYLRLLEPEMQLEKQKNELKRNEAWRVYGALLFAAGRCMHHQIKQFRGLPLPPPRAMLKSNIKLATTRMPNKRKGSTDNLAQQPPLKKQATDVPLGMPMDTRQVEMQGGTGTFRPSLGRSDAGLTSVTQQLHNDNVPGSSGGSREKCDGQLNKSATLAQAWKDDVNAGHLLASLFEHFGESMFAFTPAPELSLFL